MNCDNVVVDRSRDVDKKDSGAGFFGTRGLLLLLVLPLAVLFIFCGWYTLRMYAKFKATDKQYHRVMELSGSITHYDEVLTMSARMAAATGELKWEQRYRSFEPQLDSYIKEVFNIAPEDFMAQAVQQTDTANMKLVAMENKAFEMVRSGNLKAACDLLYSQEYRQQKRIYSNGISQLTDAMREHMESETDKYHIVVLTTVTLWTVCASFLLFSFVFILQKHKLVGQRKAREKIERQKEFLNNVLDSLAHPLYVIDANDYTIKIANSAACQGRLAEGMKCHMLSHKQNKPCTGPDHLCVLEEVKRTGKPVVVEHIHYDVDKNTRYVEVRGFPFFGKDGKISEIIEFCLDITEKKQIESDLKQAKERAELIFRLVPSSVFTVDRNNVITSVNDRLCQMTGFAPEDMIGKSCTEFALEPCCVKGGLYAQDVEKPVIGKECKIQTKDGRVLNISKNVDFVRDSHGEIIGGIVSFEDITATKQIEQRQHKLVEELESVNRELKDFAYIISHDLKAPLRGITTLADWISSDYEEKLDDQGKEKLRLLKDRASKMHNMIEGVLQYSRVGRIREEKVSVDLNVLIGEVIDTIGLGENVEILVENELPVVNFEPVRIRQIFQNLLGNAVKYMDKPKGWIKIGCVADGDFWKFSVADNGPGIEEKNFERIFKIFQTLTPQEEFESAGVGLTVVKRIVELYGGKIWLESELAKGTTFLFTLPKEQIGVEADEGLEAHIVS